MKVCSRVEAFVAFFAEIVSLYLMLFQLVGGVESLEDGFSQLG